MASEFMGFCTGYDAAHFEYSVGLGLKVVPAPLEGLQKGFWSLELSGFRLR